MSSVSSLRIGVSIYVRKGAQSLWENGIFQNCLFLAIRSEERRVGKECSSRWSADH